MPRAVRIGRVKTNCLAERLHGTSGITQRKQDVAQFPVNERVAAGDVCQSMHCAAMTAVRLSAIIETGAALAAK